MKKFASVATYLKAVPPAPRAALQQLRKTIKAAAPEALVRRLVKARIAQNERKR
jgi:uncharacterized protein YdhG (YjbR/CyaY superfamily)